MTAHQRHLKRQSAPQSFRKPVADLASTRVRQVDAPEAAARASIYTARLTINVTPALRGRIKVLAFKRGVTAAEMLRELLEREYGGGQP
jgi:hypothetical protein